MKRLQRVLVPQDWTGNPVVHLVRETGGRLFAPLSRLCQLQTFPPPSLFPAPGTRPMGRPHSYGSGIGVRGPVPAPRFFFRLRHLRVQQTELRFERRRAERETRCRRKTDRPIGKDPSMAADALLLIESLVDQALDGSVLLGAAVVATLFLGPSLVQAVRRHHHD